MLADERRTILLELVRAKGFASLPELAGQLSVSESTIRRDLDFLEDSGSARRTHGGVFYTGPSPKLAVIVLQCQVAHVLFSLPIYLHLSHGRIQRNIVPWNPFVAKYVVI